MPTFYTVVTDTGLAKIAAALAAGTTVNLTEMAVGDGNGNAVTVSQTRTALVREVFRAALNQLYQDNTTPSLFIAELVIPTGDGGWTVREVGLFDDEGDLIAYANFPATYKPTIGEGATQDLIIQIYVQVSNAAAINVSISPLVVQASRQWVQANFLSLLGGTTGQIIRKVSNADNDIEWVNLNLSDFNITVVAEEEAQTLAAAQTTVTWANISTAGIAVYIDGIRLRQGIDYTVTNGTTIELGSAYPDGTPILGVRNDPNGSITPGGIGALAIDQNLADVADKEVGRANLGVPYADQTEAETGTEAAKVLSPLTAKQQVDARIASQAEAQGGTNNVKLMTSLRTKQQIDSRIATPAQAIDPNNNVNLLTPQGAVSSFNKNLLASINWYRMTRIGNDVSSIAAIGLSICSLGVSRVAIFDNNTAQLKAYQFDGTNWTMSGSALTITGVSVGANSSITAISSTRIAYVDTSNRQLRTYEFNGTVWQQIGVGLAIPGTFGLVEVTAMSSTRIALWDNERRNLYAYDFDLTNWAQVGSGLAIPGNSTAGARSYISALTQSVIALNNLFTDEIYAYEFDGSDWSQKGAQLSFPEANRICSLSQSDILVQAGLTGRVLRFDGAGWVVNVDFGILDFSLGNMAAISGSEVASAVSNGGALNARRLAFYIGNGPHSPSGGGWV